MSDVVISGRIPTNLMNEIRKLGKSNTEILNKALKLYIREKNHKEKRKQRIYKNKQGNDYNTTKELVDQLINRYFKDSNNKKEVKT